MLKDSEQDKTYFIMNEEYLDPDVRYHFTLNPLYKKTDKLRDIFATVLICNKYYKIYFF